METKEREKRPKLVGAAEPKKVVPRIESARARACSGGSGGAGDGLGKYDGRGMGRNATYVIAIGR